MGGQDDSPVTARLPRFRLCKRQPNMVRTALEKGGRRPAFTPEGCQVVCCGKQWKNAKADDEKTAQPRAAVWLCRARKGFELRVREASWRFEVGTHGMGGQRECIVWQGDSQVALTGDRGTEDFAQSPQKCATILTLLRMLQGNKTQVDATQP